MATTPKDQQQRGKPLPPGGTKAQHGTRTMFLYGCRCEPCRQAESDYARRRRQAIKDGTWVSRATTTEEATP